jgi:hypothetical protein
MQIKINDVLRDYIEPLTEAERTALERSLLAEGCRDALVLWGDVLVDGHNRYGICRKHGLPFQTVQSTRFHSMEDVHLWMIDQHLGRRSLSDFQRGVLALRKREIVAERRARQMAAPGTAVPAGAGSEAPSTPMTPTPTAEALTTREALAKAARLSSSQVVMIEKIHQHAAPELVAALKSGAISINAAAAVASLPAAEQVAAAAAGADELKQAAKRVREAKRRPPKGSGGEATALVMQQAPHASVAATPDPGADIEALRQRVAALSAENQALRQQVAALKARLGEDDSDIAEPAEALGPPF